MSFTEIWNNLTPLDTSLANTYASVLRALKNDIQQRMAAFAFGPIASRPTPDTGLFGSVGAGVLFLATDTWQAFLWNGTSWTEVLGWELRRQRSNPGVVITALGRASIQVFFTTPYADTNYTIVGVIPGDSGVGRIQFISVTAKAAASVTLEFVNTDSGASHTITDLELTTIHD